MAFEIEGKEMYPIFVFAKCCWSIQSKVVKTWQACAQRTEKPLPYKLCSYTSSLCTCPASSRQVYAHALHIVWCGPTSETVCMQRRQKN